MATAIGFDHVYRLADLNKPISPRVARLLRRKNRVRRARPRRVFLAAEFFLRGEREEAESSEPDESFVWSAPPVVGYSQNGYQYEGERLATEQAEIDAEILETGLGFAAAAGRALRLIELPQGFADQVEELEEDGEIAGAGALLLETERPFLHQLCAA